MIKYSHNKKCFACGQSRPKSLLGYDLLTLKSYCIDHRCLNASAIPTKELYPLDSHTLELVLSNTPDLSRLIGKSIAARLQPYLALHVLNVAKENKIDSINEVILYILNRDMETQECLNASGVYQLLKGPEPEPIPDPEPQSQPEPIVEPEPVEEIREPEEIKIVINDKVIEPEVISVTEPKEPGEVEDDDFEI